MYLVMEDRRNQEVVVHHDNYCYETHQTRHFYRRGERERERERGVRERGVRERERKRGQSAYYQVTKRTYMYM